MGRFSLQISRHIFTICISLLVLNACSVRPIYYDDEKAVAARGVVEFHRLLSEENYEGIYNLIDEEMQRAESKDVLLAAMRQTYERWGKVQSTTLDRAEVFPGAVSEVRMAYRTTYEKGAGIEWFIWRVNGSEARLVQYQNFPAQENSTPSQ